MIVTTTSQNSCVIHALIHRLRNLPNLIQKINAIFCFIIELFWFFNPFSTGRIENHNFGDFNNSTNFKHK